MFDIEYTNLAVTQVSLHKTMFAELLLRCSILHHTNTGHCGYVQEGRCSTLTANITFVFFLHGFHLSFSCVTDSVFHFGNKGRINIYIYIYAYCETQVLCQLSAANFFLLRKRGFFHYIVICLCDLVSVVKINLKSTLQKKHPYGKETALLKKEKKRKEISPDLKVFVKS